MRKRWATFSIILVIGFLLGGAVVAHNANLSFVKALTGNESTQTVQASQQKTATVKTASNIQTTASIADMVEKAGPAVVNVETQVKVNSSSGDNPLLDDPFFRQFFGNSIPSQPQSQYETGIGTGFLISSDGYIITNQHVIDGATKITVQVPNRKQKLTAKVVGQDYELDLAVLKIDGTGYPTLTLGNSDKMRVGDSVVAIGEPYGLDHTVTTGVVSAKGRPVTIENRSYKNLIQTDAAINPGNSGGPLLNMSGQVIAINTAVNSEAQGIGFAIPINTVSDVLNQLMNGSKIVRPYMGIQMTDITDDVSNQLNLPANTTGVLVVKVLSGTPAEKAGLKQMDIIKKIDDKEVTSASQVQSYIEQKKVGDRISVQVQRDGNQAGLLVQLAEKP